MPYETGPVSRPMASNEELQDIYGYSVAWILGGDREFVAICGTINESKTEPRHHDDIAEPNT